ncbi:hypothetical protein [Cyanobium sp. Morenito 9A2]|uniref:hypothetical protein n=1 Tax=Cyanobium sp. Morenito 9A2 TaxID=2823718 RepID=UPI0020CD275A|nr:hypothetical protein [Cyanobium sp. Morenito 9A2]MCP9850068.1 hypothetical protein [Cyanobium sp. Morenito 9A2]
MGLFDRLLGNRSWSKSTDEKPKKDTTTYYLDPDASSSLGNVEFMRSPNTIRRTFPGNVDSPGGKEFVQEVDSMAARVDKADGLPGTARAEASLDLTGGVPKAVKKTFAQRLSASELTKRMNGSAVAGVNQPGAPAPRRAKSDDLGSQPSSSVPTAKPGSADAWLNAARDLNN